MVERLALEQPVAHEVQQRAQRRACPRDGAVVEVVLRDAPVGGDDVVERIGELVRVLQLGPEHGVGEDGVRVVEDAAEEGVHELARDAVAEPAREDLAPAGLEVAQFLQHPVRDEPARVTLLRSEAAP